MRPPAATDPFIEKYLDVLQNIETVIIEMYRAHPEINDQNVRKVLETLERAYKAELNKRNPPPLKFTPLEQELYEAVKSVCDWRIGRTDNPKLTGNLPKLTKTIGVDEIEACLKRTLRSLNLWNKEYGIRGYLNYIAQFFPEKGSES